VAENKAVISDLQKQSEEVSENKGHSYSKGRLFGAPCWPICGILRQKTRKNRHFLQKRTQACASW